MSASETRDEAARPQNARELSDQRMEEQIKAIAAAISCGAEGRMDKRQGYAALLLTEEAVERLLALCGANPLPESSRPSKASNKREKARRSRLLTRRVLRALGSGQAGHVAANQKFTVSIWFGSNPTLYCAAQQLGADRNKASSLCELLAC